MNVKDPRQYNWDLVKYNSPTYMVMKRLVDFDVARADLLKDSSSDNRRAFTTACVDLFTIALQVTE